MTLHPATPADTPAIATFLARHEAASIFPLANLIGQGPAPQTLWIARTGDRMAGVIALSASGFLMPQWPDLDPAAVLRALSGQRVAAILGEATQVRSLLALFPAPRLLTREPLCTLDLAHLIQPEAQGTDLRPLRLQDAAMVADLRLAYNHETLAEPGPDAPDTPASRKARLRAEADVARWRQADSHRLLWRGGQPVALTGLNARLPDVVQVGGVFTPKPWRNQGLARRAVAFHLAEARAQGARRAVLFAANDAALAAYRAIGFTQIGWMSLALFESPMTP